MAFKLFKDQGSKFAEPLVSVTAAGVIALNKTCLEKFIGNKRFVELYYDKDNSMVGIKCVDKQGENRFKITHSPDKKSGTIAGRSFLNYLKIDYSKSRRYVPDWNEEESMLTFKIGGA